MNDEEVRTIAAAVDRYLAGLLSAAREAGLPTQLSLRTDDFFRNLVAQILSEPGVRDVSARCLSLPNPGKVEFLATVALCALGPGGIPPNELRSALVLRVEEVLQGIKAQRAGRSIRMPSADRFLAFERMPAPQARDGAEPLEDVIYGLTMVFGCGKWRIPAEGRAAWDGIWTRAYEALAGVIEHSVLEVLPWLARAVPGFPSYPTDSQLSAAAAEFALQVAGALIVPPVPIGKAKPLRGTGMHELWLNFDGDALRCDVDGVRWFEPAGLPAGARLAVGDCHGGSVERPPGKPHLGVPPGGKIVALARDDGVWVYVYWVGRNAQRQTGLLKLAIGDPVAVKLRGGSISVCGCGRFKCAEQHCLGWGWDVYSHSVPSCAAVAVKGPNTALLPGTFAQGLFADILTRTGWA